MRSKCTFYRLELKVFWSDVETAYRDPFSGLAGAGFVSEASSMANAQTSFPSKGDSEEIDAS